MGNISSVKLIYLLNDDRQKTALWNGNNETVLTLFRVKNTISTLFEYKKNTILTLFEYNKLQYELSLNTILTVWIQKNTIFKSVWIQ